MWRLPSYQILLIGWDDKYQARIFANGHQKYPASAVRLRKARGRTSHDLLQNASLPQSVRHIMKTLCRAAAASASSEPTLPQATSYHMKLSTGSWQPSVSIPRLSPSPAMVFTSCLKAWRPGSLLLFLHSLLPLMPREDERSWRAQ